VKQDGSYHRLRVKVDQDGLEITSAPRAFRAEEKKSERHEALVLLSLGLGEDNRFLKRLLRGLMRLCRMLQRLLGMLVPGQMIAFVVVRCGNTMGVGRELVELRRSLV
jgi:hypothetical protein